MRTLSLTLSATLLALGTPALAESRRAVDLPAGSLTEAVAALGRQAGVSIRIADRRLGRQRVPAVRGRLTMRETLERLLAGSGATFAAIDGRSWRIHRAPAPRRMAAPPPPPVARDEPAEEIVVTASKQDTLLADYAGTATLLDAADLSFGGVEGTEAIASRMASVTSTHLGAGRNKLFVRGIADSSFTGPTQSTVGQYLGDVRVAYNAPDPDLRLYDIASVEVLEGPQGTLYGAGSLGGIIRVTRNVPRLDMVEGEVIAGAATTAHGAESGDLGGMLNLPIAAGRLGLRVVAYGAVDGGYIDDRARGLEDVNRVETVGGRAMLRASLGSGWTVDLGGTIQDIDGRDSQYADRDGPPLTRESPIAQGYSGDYRLGELVIGKEWGDLAFLSSTGIVRQRVAERFDATEAGGPPRLFRQWNRTELISTENRLSRRARDGFSWVVGTSLIRNEARLTRSIGPVATPMPATGVRNHIDEATLYGEATIEPVDGLTLTGGGRLTHSRLSGEALDVARTVTLADRQVQADRSATALLPSFSVSAAPIRDLILFVRYQEGFRPGGLAVSGDFVRRFRNDSVATLEAGVRYGIPGLDDFDFAATMAYTRWNNIQADFIDGVGLPTTANIGNGRIYSFDAKIGWQPLPGLGIELAAVVNDGKITDPDPGFRLATLAMGGLPNVAQLDGRAGFDYETMLSDDADLRVAGWARYVGRSRLGVGPVLGAPQGDYLDTGLAIRVGWRRLGLTVGATNLLDSIGNRFALGTPFDVDRGDEITPLRPRTVRIGIDARF